MLLAAAKLLDHTLLLGIALLDHTLLDHALLLLFLLLLHMLLEEGVHVAEVEVGVQDVVVGVHLLEAVVSGGGEYVEVGVYSVEDEVVVEAPPPPDPLLNHQSA